jgi:hypothetical protein
MLEMQQLYLSTLQFHSQVDKKFVLICETRRTYHSSKILLRLLSGSIVVHSLVITRHFFDARQ